MRKKRIVKKQGIKTLDGSKVKNAKKSVFDGLNFDSNLELFTYKSLKAANIHNFTREDWTVPLIEGFTFSGVAIEAAYKIIPGQLKSVKKKKKHVILEERGNKIKPMTYTPDFISINEKKVGWVIECKGWAGELVPLKRKLFKKYLTDKGYKVHYFEPNDQKNVLKCIEIIKKEFYK